MPGCDGFYQIRGGSGEFQNFLHPHPLGVDGGGAGEVGVEGGWLGFILGSVMCLTTPP